MASSFGHLDPVLLVLGCLVALSTPLFAGCTLAQFPGEHSRPSTSPMATWRLLRGAVWS